LTGNVFAFIYITVFQIRDILHCHTLMMLKDTLQFTEPEDIHYLAVLIKKYFRGCARGLRTVRRTKSSIFFHERRCKLQRLLYRVSRAFFMKHWWLLHILTT